MVPYLTAAALREGAWEMGVRSRGDGAGVEIPCAWCCVLYLVWKGCCDDVADSGRSENRDAS